MREWSVLFICGLMVISKKDKRFMMGILEFVTC